MVETDELIRQKLNRRDRVVEIRERNENQIGRSKNHLEMSKSPTR
jgi:hypothetical protein